MKGAGNMKFRELLLWVLLVILAIAVMSNFYLLTEHFRLIRMLTDSHSTIIDLMSRVPKSP